MSLLSVVKRLPEWAARFYVAEVCLAVKTLHEHGVMHRWAAFVVVHCILHAKDGAFVVVIEFRQ